MFTTISIIVFITGILSLGHGIFNPYKNDYCPPWILKLMQVIFGSSIILLCLKYWGVFN
jgi:hypothetical protein